MSKHYPISKYSIYQNTDEEFYTLLHAEVQVSLKHEGKIVPVLN